MKIAISGIGFAFLFAACSSGDQTKTPDGTGDHSGGGGNSSASSGHAGATAGAKGGASGKAGGQGVTATAGAAGATGGTGGDTGGTGGAAGGTAGAAGQGGSGGKAGGTAGKGGAAGGKVTSGNSGGTATGAAGGGSVGKGGGGPATDGGKTGGSDGSTTPGAGGSGSGSTPTPLTGPVVVTSEDKERWKEVTPATGSGTADVTVNDSSKNQKWDGMGGTFNEVGWDQLKKLSAADQQKALQDLFGADGADFAYGRVPIGASDYALTRYTLDDTKDDYDMASFSIEHDKQYLIPYIQAALAVKSDIILNASPWTPPGWMKSNQSTDSGSMNTDEKTLKAFALYLAKFVEEYGKEHINIKIVYPQNEPGYTNPYPSCSWDQATFIKFIGSYLGPTFAERNVPAEIWCGTMSKETDGTIAVALSNDSTAMKYVKGFGLQWNTMSNTGTLASKGTVMMTEHRCGNYSFDTDHTSKSSYNASKAPNDWAYGVESWQWITDWVKAGVNSYMAWNMVLDSVGKNNNSQTPWPQDALLIVDGGKLVETPAYFTFKHISHFVHPGGNRVGTSGSFSDVLAFKNSDGSKVAILHNKDAAKKVTVAIGGSSYQFDIPGNGFATIAVP